MFTVGTCKRHMFYAIYAPQVCWAAEISDPRVNSRDGCACIHNHPIRLHQPETKKKLKDPRDMTLLLTAKKKHGWWKICLYIKTHHGWWKTCLYIYIYHYLSCHLTLDGDFVHPNGHGSETHWSPPETWELGDKTGERLVACHSVKSPRDRSTPVVHNPNSSCLSIRICPEALQAQTRASALSLSSVSTISQSTARRSSYRLYSTRSNADKEKTDRFFHLQKSPCSIRNKGLHCLSGKGNAPA